MKTLMFLFGLTILLNSCTNRHFPIVKHSFTTDFGQYKTYNVYSVSSDSKEKNKLSESIKNEVDYQMELRGYKHDTDCPQISVFYTLSNKKISIANPNADTDEIYFVGTETDSESKNGTFLIEVIDNQTKKVVWLGYFNQLNSLGHELSASYLKLITKDILRNYQYFVEKKPKNKIIQETPTVSAIF